MERKLVNHNNTYLNLDNCSFMAIAFIHWIVKENGTDYISCGMVVYTYIYLPTNAVPVKLTMTIKIYVKCNFVGYLINPIRINSSTSAETFKSILT